MSYLYWGGRVKDFASTPSLKQWIRFLPPLYSCCFWPVCVDHNGIWWSQMLSPPKLREKSSSQIIACHLSMSPSPFFWKDMCVCLCWQKCSGLSYLVMNVLPDVDFLLAVILRVWEAYTEKILNHTVETKKPCEIWLGYLMAYLGMKVLACDPVISSLV